MTPAGRKVNEVKPLTGHHGGVAILFLVVVLLRAEAVHKMSVTLHHQLREKKRS